MFNNICGICIVWAAPTRKGPLEVPAAPPESCPVGLASVCPHGLGTRTGLTTGSAPAPVGSPPAARLGDLCTTGSLNTPGQQNPPCEPHPTSTPSLKSYISVKFSAFVCFLSPLSHLSVKSTSQVDLPPPHIFAMFFSLRSLFFRINRCYLVSLHTEALPYFGTFSCLLSKTYNSAFFYSERSGGQRITSGRDAPKVWAVA